MLNAVKWFFSKVFRVFKKFLKGVTKILMKEGAAYILDVARMAVMEMAQSDLTSEEKRNQAFNKIQKYAALKGVSVSTSVINSVIELTYQELKDTLEDG